MKAVSRYLSFCATQLSRAMNDMSFKATENHKDMQWLLESACKNTERNGYYLAVLLLKDVVP
jgi:hypothetical protein